MSREITGGSRPNNAPARKWDTPRAWETARFTTSKRYAQWRALGYGGAAATAVALFMDESPVAIVVAALSAEVSASAWVLVHHADQGARRHLRESYEGWLYAETARFAIGHVETAYSVATRTTYAQSATSLPALRHITELGLELEKARAEAERQKHVAEHWVRECEKLHTEHEALTVRLIEQQAVATGLRPALQAAGASATALAAVEPPPAAVDAPPPVRTAVEPRALYYPEPGPVTDSSIGRAPTALRDEAEAARDRAERGVVIESPVVGAMLSESARWSVFAAPVHMTRELLELFEPFTTAPTAAVHDAPKR